MWKVQGHRDGLAGWDKQCLQRDTAAGLFPQLRLPSATVDGTYTQTKRKDTLKKKERNKEKNIYFK